MPTSQYASGLVVGPPAGKAGVEPSPSRIEAQDEVQRGSSSTTLAEVVAIAICSKPGCEGVHTRLWLATSAQSVWVVPSVSVRASAGF